MYKSHDGIKLYGGPLGKTFGGVNPGLTFNAPIKCYPSKVFPVLQSSVKRAFCVKEPNAMRVIDVPNPTFMIPPSLTRKGLP